MATISARGSLPFSLWAKARQLPARLALRRATVFALIMVVALLGFELFNYITTEYALTQLLGEPRFVGLRWATILALAFCGMDFAGIAYLLTPDRRHGRPFESRYLLAAWFLAGSMNAILTWWAVSSALLARPDLGNELLSRGTMLKVVPIFVAALVWLMRVLLIGTFSLGGMRSSPVHRQERPVRGGLGLQPKPETQNTEHAPNTVPTPSRPRPVPALSHSRPLQRDQVPLPRSLQDG